MTFTYTDNASAFLEISDFNTLHIAKASERANHFFIIWNQSGTLELDIDEVPHQLNANQVITLTPTQFIRWKKIEGTGVIFKFNREFYCILDNDHEVSCAGFVFFGSTGNQIIQLNAGEQRKFELLLQVFYDEFGTRDNIQGEMLRMLLKRLIIITTRLAKEQSKHMQEIRETELDIVRQYHMLVEMHFREKQRVVDYADLMNRSPKTLANLFAKFNQKTPLQIIHERILTEAKRLLFYTNKSVKEIAFELGFDEPAQFSRFFKNGTGTTPLKFKLGLVNAN